MTTHRSVALRPVRWSGDIEISESERGSQAAADFPRQTCVTDSFVPSVLEVVSSSANTVGVGMHPYPATVEELYRWQFAEVLRTVLPIVGRLELAKDVTQDAFEIAARRWWRVSRLDRPDLWVRRVAINRAITVRRRDSHEKLGLSGVREAACRAEQWSPDTTAVFKALRDLPRRQVQVTVLVYFGGLRLAEAARALRISESTARTHHKRALERLESSLAEIPTEE